MEEPEGFALKISFGKNVLSVSVSPTTCIETLRAQLFDLTRVAPDRQKLNVVGGKKPENDLDTVAVLGWTSKVLWCFWCIHSCVVCKPRSQTKIQLIGTPEENVFVFDAAEQQGNVAEEDDEESLELHMRPENRKKLQLRLDTVQVEEISPREHDRLLVLDIDYTLYDHITPCEQGLFDAMVKLLLYILFKCFL